jgi:hypothetical protein
MPGIEACFADLDPVARFRDDYLVRSPHTVLKQNGSSGERAGSRQLPLLAPGMMPLGARNANSYIDGPEDGHKTGR